MKNYNERLLHYATAKRATAGKITQIENGKLVTHWAGKLRGTFVKLAQQIGELAKSTQPLN